MFLFLNFFLSFVPLSEIWKLASMHYTGRYRRSGISRVYLWTEWTHNDQEVHQGYCQLEIVQTVGGFLKFWQIKGKILLKALIVYTDIALCCIDNLHISHNALGMEANIWVLLIPSSSSHTSLVVNSLELLCLAVTLCLYEMMVTGWFTHAQSMLK